MFRALMVAALLAAAPEVADACLNETMSYDAQITALKKAETHLKLGEPAKARGALARIHMMGGDHRLATRIADIEHVIEIRTRKSNELLKQARDHFADRLTDKKASKDARLKAWLAEAHLALGEVELGMKILVELDKADLMPDAFAHLALASASSGDEQAKQLAVCKKKAAAKKICVLPKPTS